MAIFPGILNVYTDDGSLADLFPKPILIDRDPTTADFAPLGQTWINYDEQTVWALVSTTGGSATWATAPTSGATEVTSLTVDPGDITVVSGNITITAGDLTLDNGNISVSGNVDISGDVTIAGDFDITDTGSISIVSTNDAADAILIHANTGGTSSQVHIQNTPGTAVDSIEIESVVGGVTISSGLASADAINLSSLAGGIDVDAALQVNIASSQNAASAIVINASAGGMDLTAAGAAGEDVDITNTAGSVNISAGEAAADAIVLNASDAAGGLQLQAGSNGILIGNQADCAVIDVGDIAPTASRLITIGGGTVVTASVTDQVDIGVDGATTNADSIKTINIGTGLVEVGENNNNIGTGNQTSGTHVVNISTGTTAGGTKTVNIGASGTAVNIDGTFLLNDSVNTNSGLNTGTSTGTVTIGNAAAGAIAVDTAAGISLDGATASNFTVTGATQDLTLSSVGGSVNIGASEAAADAIVLNASDAAGGVQIQAGSNGILIGNEADCAVIDIGDVVPTSARTITIAGGAVGSAIADTLDLGPDGCTDAGGSKVVNLNSGALVDGTLTTNINSGNVTAGTHALNLSTGTGTKTVNIGNADVSTTSNVIGPVNINVSHNANTAINSGTSTGTLTLGNSAAGAITIDSGAGVSIDAATASNLTAAAGDLSLVATAGSIVISGGEAVVDAVKISTTNAAGGIDIDSGTGGITVDSTGAISLGGSGASDFTLSSGDLTLESANAVNIVSTENAADAIYLHADGGTSSTIRIHNDTGTGDDSIRLISDGGGINLNSGGNVTMSAATGSAASPTTTLALEGHMCVATFTGFALALSTSQSFTITNALATSSAHIVGSACHMGTNNAPLSVGFNSNGGSLIANVTNTSTTTATNGDIKIFFWIVNG